MANFKKYIPRPELIPAIAAIGFVGAIVGLKAFPILAGWIANKTPTVQKPAAG